jgi:hypothetical protein
LKRRLVIVCFIISILAVGVDASDYARSGMEHLLASQSILLDAVSWKEFPILCKTGDTLSGEFLLTRDGDLFIGDQTKYDNWLLGGIDFLILDEENYNLWVGGNLTTPLFERETVAKLTWSVEIPKDGLWYVVYFNDSIYMKQVEESIQHHTNSNPVILLSFLSIVDVATIFVLALIYKPKKMNELWRKKPQHLRIYL